MVNVFPARRARDLLMLMGLVFAAGLVLLLRFIQPERLIRVESLPDITDFFATLQSPITPMLPSFWAGEALFAGMQGGVDCAAPAALWTTAGAFTVMLGAAHGPMALCWIQPVAGGAEGALRPLPGARPSSLRRCRSSPVRGHLLVKDVKVFLRDVSQWVQLLPLLALVLLYLYNFQALDLDRIPYMSGVHQERLRIRQSRDGGVCHGDRGGSLRVSGRVGRGRRVLDHPDVARLDARLPVVEVLDGAACRCCSSPRR